jgi:hypothetical protein
MHQACIFNTEVPSVEAILKKLGIQKAKAEICIKAGKPLLP